MYAINTTSLTNLFAKTLIQSINNTHFVYYFIGRQSPWATEPYPPIPNDTINSFYDVWNNMIAAKLITINNVSLVIPNITWASNTVYTAYSDTNQTLYSSNFYVITSNNEVYKCLSNNNSAVTTVAPVGFGSPANNYTQTTADGYTWKYMLNIQPGDAFFSPFWIPIPVIAPINSAQYIIQQAAVSGSIDMINVTNGGTGYANGSNCYIITITGDGSGANAYANVVGGTIQNLVMQNRGINYTYANVTIGGTGTGANATVIISPPGGHGSHTDAELGANTLMFAINTVNSESGYFSTSTTFHQNGLLIDILQYGSNTVATNALVNTCTQLLMTAGIGNYTNGEILYQGPALVSASFTCQVIDFNIITNVVRVNNLKGTPMINSILYGSSSGSQRYLSNLINPDIQPYSGILQEINNLPPITRAPTQTETGKFILRF